MLFVCGTLVSCDLASDVNRDGVVRIACIGDSNTDVSDGWCSGMMTDMASLTRPKWEVLNYARSGATIIDAPPLLRSWWFQAQVDEMLAEPVPPDVVILAGGTNDARWDFEVGVVIDKLFSLKEQIEEGTAVLNQNGSVSTAVVIIATVPQIYSPVADQEPYAPLRTEAYTDAIRSSFSPVNLLDFRTIVDRSDYTDEGVHFQPSGHKDRADAAYRKLTGGEVPPF